jgi:CRP-like cAMP-binding protein
MPDAGMIRKQVEARLAELEATIEPLRTEYDQLKKVAATLTEAGGAAASASKAGPARRAPGAAGRARAAASGGGGGSGGGSRAEQAVALIGAQPGVTAAQLAESMGISRNYLYRVLPKLELRGVIRKEGQGYQLSPAATGD